MLSCTCSPHLFRTTASDQWQKEKDIIGCHRSITTYICRTVFQCSQIHLVSSKVSHAVYAVVVEITYTVGCFFFIGVYRAAAIVVDSLRSACRSWEYSIIAVVAIASVAYKSCLRTAELYNRSGSNPSPSLSAKNGCAKAQDASSHCAPGS